MTKLFYGLIFILFISLAQAQDCPILPTPVVYTTQAGSLNFSNNLAVDLTHLNQNLKAQLIALADTYHQLKIESSQDKSLITFKKLENVKQDSYSINVNESIIISYSSDRSCYYAFHSLMQMIQKTNANDNEFSISKSFVKDYPSYQWRGLHLDVARHFFSVEEVKRFIDQMAIYKFNVFHWHLTDDQGWRIEIKKYPKLTNIGAWRDSTVENHFTTAPRTYKKERYGGFYTQEEIKEIVAYAQERYITVVPEIEMPGHARAALAAYPMYSCTGIQQEVPGLWGIFDDIFCAKEESIVFLQDILSEVIPLFPGEFIHVGGDEAPKTRWHNCTKCQAIMKEQRLKDEHELQSYFIQRMDKYLLSKGKKLIGWDEILEGGLSPNAAVMSWRGFDGGIEAANQEHQVVMSPGSHCYFDHYQGKGSEEPLAIGGFTPLEKVYEFQPIPRGLDSFKASYILGGQANLWTEYIPDFNQLMYMTYPRAIALSQALWCEDLPKYELFEKTLMNKHLDLLTANKINYSPTFLKPNFSFTRTKTGIDFKVKSKSNEEQFEFKDRSDSSLNLNFKGTYDLPINRTRGIKKLTYSVNSLTTGIQKNIAITNNPCLGVPVVYLTKPSNQYNNGDLTLVDGQFGARPWKGNEWIGFDTSVVVIQIDLTKKQRIDSLQISFLKDENSWIHLPCSIEFQDLKTKKGKGIGAAPNFYDERQVLYIGKKVQKFTITIKTLDQIPQGKPGAGSHPWLFIDEISIKNK